MMFGCGGGVRWRWDAVVTDIWGETVKVFTWERHDKIGILAILEIDKVKKKCINQFSPIISSNMEQIYINNCFVHPVNFLKLQKSTNKHKDSQSI